MPTKEQNPVIRQTLRVGVGEAIVCLLIIGVYLLLDLAGVYPFTYKVITGALLGALVIVGNFFFLALSVDRATLEAMQSRPAGEMSDEQIEKWTQDHKGKVEAAVKLSFIVRMISMVGALVLAFLLPCFEVIATLVPLLMLRPILMVGELLPKKEDKP